MRTIQAGAVLALIAFWSGAGAACELPARSFIPFTPYAQQTSEWCWVASGQITMNSIRPNSVQRQCEAVSRVVRARGGGDVDCCKRNTPQKCRITNKAPPYAEYKFDFRSTSGDVLVNVIRRALPWKEVKEQIHCEKKPFAFSRMFAPSYGSGHMMVAYGYEEKRGEKLVYFFDPLPSVPSERPDQPDKTVDKKDRLDVLTYDEYLKDREHLHGQAFYDISFRGSR